MILADGEPRLKQNESQEYDKSEFDRKNDGTPDSALIMRSSEKRTAQPEMPKDEKTRGELNMEASVTTDDVVKAGGFGVTDSICSFLPVAMDCTDFECSLRDARDFEEPQGEISRPGLGYLDSKIDKDACTLNN